MKPVFSAATEKMKSVCGSGRNFSLLCEASPFVTEPVMPPLPTVTIDCQVW